MSVDRLRTDLLACIADRAFLSDDTLPLTEAEYVGNPDRDTRHAAGLKKWQRKFQERFEKQRKAARVNPNLIALRWMLEEMRVSLFAQGLRTPYPISWKRLDKVWSEWVG